MQHKKKAVLSPQSYSFVYYYLLAGIILLVVAFLFVHPASADRPPASESTPFASSGMVK